MARPAGASARPVLLTDQVVYGEGPRWHDGRLWFTDGPAGAVKAVDDAGRVEVMVEIERASGLGWLPDGTLVISSLYEAALTRWDGETLAVAHDFSDRAWSTNDMVAGPDGSIYVDLYRRTDHGISGEILHVSPDGRTRTVVSDILLPNGLTITPDGSTLIASDTRGCRLLAFTIDPDGGLSHRRVFADLGQGHHPDGICLDRDGAVWVGCYDAEVFLRVLEGGEVTQRIETGGGWAVAPALGGPDRCRLHLVINETTHEDLVVGRSSGRIEWVDVEVPGAGWP